MSSLVTIFLLHVRLILFSLHMTMSTNNNHYEKFMNNIYINRSRPDTSHHKHRDKYIIEFFSHPAFTYFISDV